MSKFHLLVLGGGSGGMACAQRAAELGASVALFDECRLGGSRSWINSTVSKKVLYNAAQHAELMQDHKFYGFDAEKEGFDWDSIQEARKNYIEQLNTTKANMIKSRGKVQFIDGKAKFVNGNTVEANGQTYSGEHTLIDTGDKCFVPDLFGAHVNGTPSDNFYDMKKLPKRVGVVGNNPTAVEFASILNKLGSEVYIFDKKERLLPDFDDMIAENATQALKDGGVYVIYKSNTKGVLMQPDNTISFKTTAGLWKKVNNILWSLERTPNTADLDVDAAGVKLCEGGFVEVDEYQNTSAKNIYALGTVTGRTVLTSFAVQAGRRLANRLFNNETNSRLDYNFIPTIVYATPPFGKIGHSQAEAEAAYGAENVTVHESSFINMYFAVTERKQNTLMKLICAGPENKVVGLHMWGFGCDEMLHGFAIALQKGVTKADFEEMIHIHPPSSEGMYLEI